ncbi:tyrosine-type recombinase/integrase [Actinomadura sediminis]|uniref:Tyrosine-type recombinase/integrase n=1 Tax=Actinomadura sediminis TaxID=1038904 RepID=A0ABW3EPL9_9ACTN
MVKKKSLLRVDAGVPRQATSAPQGAEVDLDYYAQHLVTSNSRNGRPYSPGTIHNYLRCARLLVRWLDGRPLTAACDVATFNEFLRWYLAEHDVNGTAFVQRHLRNLFNWIEREEGVASPFRSRDLDTYTARKTKPKVLAREFINDLLATCASRSFYDVRDRAVIRLLLEGLRVGEVLAIRPEDVPPLTDPVLRVVPSKGELAYADGHGRRVLLALETARDLHRYVRARHRHPMAQSAPELWLGATHKPWEYDGVRQMLARRSRRAGYDAHATAHMFRHTFSHDWLDNGGSAENLMQRNGWTSVSMVQRYGKDMAENRAIEATRRMGPLY